MHPSIGSSELYLQINGTFWVGAITIVPAFAHENLISGGGRQLRGGFPHLVLFYTDELHGDEGYPEDLASGEG